MKDMPSFLTARDTMHQQPWRAAIEDAGDTLNNAPTVFVAVPGTLEHFLTER